MKKIYVRFSVLVLFLLLAGCASGVVQIGKDTYMMSNTGAWSWSSGSVLKAELYQEASEFCDKQGLKLMPIGEVANSGNFTEFAHSEIKFRCLAEDDPEYGRPWVPDTRIELKKK